MSIQYNVSTQLYGDGTQKKQIIVECTSYLGGDENEKCIKGIALMYSK